MTSSIAGASAAQSYSLATGYASSMSGVRGSLNQQEQTGQAALSLIEAAAVPIDPNIGQNIDIYA